MRVASFPGFAAFPLARFARSASAGRPGNKTITRTSLARKTVLFVNLRIVDHTAVNERRQRFARECKTTAFRAEVLHVMLRLATV